MSYIDQFDFPDLPVGALVEVIIRNEIFETMEVEMSGENGHFICGDGGWLRFNNVVSYYGVQAGYQEKRA